MYSVLIPQFVRLLDQTLHSLWAFVKVFRCKDPTQNMGLLLFGWFALYAAFANWALFTRWPFLSAVAARCSLYPGWYPRGCSLAMDGNCEWALQQVFDVILDCIIVGIEPCERILHGLILLEKAVICVKFELLFFPFLLSLFLRAKIHRWCMRTNFWKFRLKRNLFTIWVKHLFDLDPLLRFAAC